VIRAEWSETVIEVTRGDDEALQISLTDEDGEPFDVTDFAVRFTAVGGHRAGGVDDAGPG
jgi:hypothetical protein